LEETAYREGLDLVGVLEHLQKRGRSEGDRDSDLQPIATTHPSVQIMTIHASKGLEFPVVFIAGGFTSGKQPTDYLTYRDEQKHTILDLDTQDATSMGPIPGGGGADPRDLHKKERANEDRRLFYVALTRAQIKLYLPRLPVKAKVRSPGPLVTIVAPAIAKSRLADMGSPSVSVVDPTKTEKLLFKQLPIPWESAADAQPVTGPAPFSKEELFPRLDPHLSQRRIVIHSFSSLHRARRQEELEQPHFGDYEPRLDDDSLEEIEAAPDFRGPVFGDLLHAVLEQIDYAAVGQAAAPQQLLAEQSPSALLIDREIQRLRDQLATTGEWATMQQHCREQVAKLVWSALKTPLQALGGPLCTIAANDRLQELEFHFPQAQGEPPPADVQLEEGFFTGFMDLVVRCDSRFFLVDWKTNWLEDYSPAALVTAMAELDYVRQYRLYVQALVRWLRRVRGDRFVFQRDFGGVYYLFLRGLNGTDESKGVFYCRPAADDICLTSFLSDLP
jgi:exodeoxyribonuclease V beta subunit